MEASRRLAPLALFIVSALAQLHSTGSEGKSSCTASLGGASQSEVHKALLLQLKPNEDCTWTIERPEQKSIRIIFSHFQLDSDASCEREYIQVFDGNSSRSALLGRVCSKSQYIPVFESSSNSLTFRIVTDAASIQRTAFVFYYFFSPGSSIPNCGGYLDGTEGSFTSPSYPKPHPELAYCVWHIQVDEGYKIKLKIKDILLEVDKDCRFDFVAVYDGASTSSGLVGKVCGTTAPTFESSSNSLTVVLSTDYANSYRGFSASYTSLYAENINTTSLTCSSNKMRMIISKSYLTMLNSAGHNLQLKDPTCKPKITNVVEFSIPLDECGTIKKVEDHSITYTNIITFSPVPTSEVITRQKHLQIIIKCEMQHNSTVEMMYLTEDDITQNENALGRYNTSMALFVSDSYEKPLLESPYDVNLNQTLFVQVSLHSSDPNLVVFLDTCSTSPTSDFASPTYDLIKSGCTQDETCKVHPLSRHNGRFQFNAFKFLRHLGSVYLRCMVFICDSGDQQSRCNQGCVSRRKRDISSYKWKSESIIGPIRVRRDQSAGGSFEPQHRTQVAGTQDQTFQPLHVLSFTVLALNAVMVAALTVRHAVARRTDHKYQKLQGC
ncbi:PREDICTED: CUB and zona pellucida-like domain-containing protein 1 [Condylura cristata]|uniref:CUB and zona pellucida-like domain-containing protein 1 n=1 Tax=Condylura cristata TaxID=143302 RepID=UPI0003343021|nr:PREDICTED: CUB and zona pellucida-like domain-containing protein 1 [Condylura cristata]